MFGHSSSVTPVVAITKLSEIWDELEHEANNAGVLRVGASDLDDANASVFSHWLDERREAGMAWLRKNRTVREDPSTRFPWARSVVAITVAYESHRPVFDATLASRISRYAQGDDYHDVVEAILRRIEARIHDLAPEAKTRRYVDTGPLSDRAYGAQAGLGWIGRNAMLIDPDHGSWFFIGTILTSLENDLGAEEISDLCASCRQCVDACPTDAILPGRTVDSQRCISYTTIEHRGAMNDFQKENLNGNLFGCDICQEVCPWNGAPAPGHPDLAPRESLGRTLIRDLLRMSQRDFSTLFRKSAVKRAKRAGMIRNAILISSSIDDQTRESLEKEDDEGIRDALG